jgi:aspartate oxidase
LESKTITTGTDNKNSIKDPSTIFIHKQSQLRFEEIKEAVGKIMWNDVGIIRDELSLNHALKQFEDMEARLRFDGTDYFHNKARSLIHVAKIIANSALARKESRGCHFRSDIPDKSNNYLGTIIVRYNHPPRFMKI